LRQRGSAGVRGDIPADAALFETGGVGRVKEALFPHGPLEFSGYHARLDDRHGVGEVDRLYPPHPGQGESDPTSDWNASTYITNTGASRSYRNVSLVRKLQKFADVRRGTCVDDNVRRMTGKPPVGAMLGETS
jgi:hypothetical protein